MNDRTRTVCLSVIIVLCLCAAACSSASEPPGTATGPARSAADRSDQLIAELGSESTAIDAVLLALNTGFSSPQIVQGIDDDALQPDGSISDQTPAESAQNFIDFNGTDEGAFAPRLRAGNEIMLVAFQPSSEFTLQELRERTEFNARFYGGGSYGSSALGFLIEMMSDHGFSAGEVTEMLVLGIDEHMSEYGDDCPAYRVGQEVYVGIPDGVDECERPPGRYPADLFLGGFEATPEDDDSARSQEATDADEAAPEADIPATISFAGGATGPPIKPNSTKGDVEPENFFFDATVADGEVEISIVMTYWTWLRGGFEEVYVDQNCGARLVEELVGTGTAGPDTSIRFQVVSSEFTDYTGVLCQPGDGDFALSTPGEMSSRFFLGQADHTGIQGTFGAGIPDTGMQLPVAND